MSEPPNSSKALIAGIVLAIGVIYLVQQRSPERPTSSQTVAIPVATPIDSRADSPVPGVETASSTPSAAPLEMNATVPAGDVPAVTAPPAPPLPGVAPIVSTPGQTVPDLGVVDPGVLANDLEQVRMMLQEYRSAMGENPTGTNAEIMEAVQGRNLKQVKVTAPVDQRVNDKGELIDRWGTPYFFHQVSKNLMEVRSAGPDRTMWTKDDRELK